MADDLERFESWAVPLIAGLSSGERLKLAREIGTQLRRSQSRRIGLQMNPDGTGYEPRKPQLRLRNKRGAIRRNMFNKIKSPRYMRLQASPEGVALSFVGRIGRIARIHQDGLRAQVQPGGPWAQYPERKLLGFSADDDTMIREAVINHLENMIKS